MTHPTPKHKSNELISRLNDLPDGEGREFSLRKMLVEVKQLAKVDPSSAFMVTGMIYSELGDLGECKRNFKAAQALSSKPLIWRNFCSALFKHAFFDEAADVALEIERKTRGDVSVIEEALHSCICAGRLEESSALTKKLRAMKVPDLMLDGFDAIAALPAEALEAYPKICKAVSDVMSARKVRLSSNEIEHSSASQVVLRYQVYGTPEHIAEINMDLADALSNIDPHAGRHLLVLCCPDRK